MARQLRIPVGRVMGHENGVFVVEFDERMLKATKSFAKLKKDAPEYTDEMVLELLISHIAQGVE